MKNIYLLATLLWLSALGVYTRAADTFIKFESSPTTVALLGPDKPLSIVLDENVDAGIVRAVTNLQNDLHSVSGKQAIVCRTNATPNHSVLIIGDIGHSTLLADLVAKGKIQAKELLGKNEKYLILTVSNPCAGVAEATVIAGSDKRGTIYGIYELAKQAGVSPWYYWADVPIAQHPNLFVEKGTYTDGEPAVKYRGIFLNDEAPALSRWSQSTFGGFNSSFYEKVFELLLRLKANYLWPAMWGNAFYDDDPKNGVLANEMGIIMGTSHHEPMAMAQQDWHRFVKRNTLSKEWNYNTNAPALQKAWSYGIERSKNLEKIVTIGMRGDGDEAMEKGTNIALLEQIVKDQRKIIATITGQKPEKTPQVWALYKEVQDYYDSGMKVPDDVTLLFCDDNWGNVRKLPEPDAKVRKGGYGMYYHFDYVGAPRNSKWINISPVQRIWEQMNLSYTHGVKQLWVVNVGDLKPMEYPISFFMDMAWNPERFHADNLQQHTEQWCAAQFGKSYAKESARIINTYAKYNRRITPELLNDKTYSLENYNEFERVTADYRQLELDAMRLYYSIPEQYKDAFDQLVLFPTHACCNLYEMYYAVAQNNYYAARQDEKANYWADKAKYHFEQDSVLTAHYNHDIAKGKWAHMMDQVRIGYSSWQEPRERIMPEVQRIQPAKTTTKERVFVENNGYVSIEAQDFSRQHQSAKISWQIVPDMGKTKSAMITIPQNANPTNDEAIYLEYDIDFSTRGECEIQLLLSPTLNFNANKGLRYALSIDDEKPQVINFNGHYRGELGRWQADQLIRSVSKHTVATQGVHTLRFRVLDAGIVLQKILINTGGLKPSFLGPPESPLK